MSEKPRRIGKMAIGMATLAVAGVVIAPARAQNASEATYKAKCAVCHGADGKSDTPTGKNMKIGSFADPEVAKMSDEDLAEVIEKGKGKMPAYGKSLKPEQVKDLVAYIRSLAKK